MRKHSTKEFPATITGIDEDQGIVDLIFSVFGVLDDGHDIVHPGAFTKTVTERSHKVRLVDMHQTDSVLRVLGKPISFHEVRRADLPPAILSQWPEATGGEAAKVQFNMKTQAGHDSFQHIKASDVTEWSFGYDAINPDFSKMTKDGQDIDVRNLREIKLYELSPVLWGLNPATATVAVKSGPSEGKPYAIFQVGTAAQPYCIYKHDEEGEQVGSTLGCHETEEAAKEQLAALWASEDGKAAKENLTEAVDRVATAFREQYNRPNDFRYWVREVHDEFIIAEEETNEGTVSWKVSYTATDEAVTFAPSGEWIEGAFIFVPGVTAKTVKSRHLTRQNVFRELADALADVRPVALAQDTEPTDHTEHEPQAGPDAEASADPPTSDVALEIDVLREALALMS